MALGGETIAVRGGRKRESLVVVVVGVTHPHLLLWVEG